MLASASAFGLSIALTAVVLFLVRREQERGERLVLAGVRSRLDALCDRVGRFVRGIHRIVATFFLQLWWRYLVHVSLRTVLLSMSRLYEGLISYFEYNRQQAKEIRRDRKEWRESGHLSQIAAHKQATALSNDEKRKRKRDALDQ